jgi:carbamoyl-phosphate synthase large subunit
VFKDGFEIRRAAVERRIPCLTSLDTAAALLESAAIAPDEMVVRTIDEWRSGAASPPGGEGGALAKRARRVGRN